MKAKLATTHLVWVASIAALTCGCNSEPELARVWGDVTFEGQSVEDGTIEFTPVDGTGGGLVGSSIKAGSYEVPELHGARVGGTYKVAIVSMKKTGRKVPDFIGPTGEPVDEFINYIPAKYNTATEHKITVSTEDEQNHFDFQLHKGT